MRFNTGFILLTLCTGTSLATWGFGKSAYNKWHETELERWLADHDIPVPSPADRRELELTVKEHWNTKVGQPYQEWDVKNLQKYLSDKGVEVSDKSKENKNWLLETVKQNWYEAEHVAEEAYANVKHWIFDTWTDSQLKSFLDRHGIPNPTPRTRDNLLKTARENYQTVAEKLGETAAYPGNWLYEAWSESDLKKWLDERGIPAPQPSTRDKLIAQVRRNSRLAFLKAKSAAATTTDTAKAAKESIADKIFESWSDSELKAWCDKNGIPVPQGSTRNELLAIARKYRAYLSDDTISASASKFVSSATESAKSGYQEATNTVASAYSKATDTAGEYTQAAFDKAIETWSDSRLKEYLDSRGVPVPQPTTRDALLAKVRLYRHKAANGFGAWTFDTWTYDNLKKYLEGQSQSASSAASSAASGAASKASDTASKTREELVQSAKAAYASASQAGGDAYASVTSKLAQATDTAKASTFETWSDSDLKSYLDSYGIKAYQGSTRNELLANARRAQHLFLYGTTPTQDFVGKVKSGIWSLYDTVVGYVGLGKKKVEVAGDAVKESAQEGYDRAYESAQKGYDRTKETATRMKDKVKEEL